MHKEVVASKGWETDCSTLGDTIRPKILSDRGVHDASTLDTVGRCSPDDRAHGPQPGAATFDVKHSWSAGSPRPGRTNPRCDYSVRFVPPVEPRVSSRWTHTARGR